MQNQESVDEKPPKPSGKLKEENRKTVAALNLLAPTSNYNLLLSPSESEGSKT